jgi:hypothetical protein
VKHYRFDRFPVSRGLLVMMDKHVGME